METPDNAKERLRDILNQKEYTVYNEENRNIIQQWWDGAKEWFRNLVFEWLSALEPSAGFADTLFVILIGVMILLLLLTLFLVIRSVSRKRNLKEQQPFQSMNELEWSVGRHLREAKSQADVENYSVAARHQFLALLLYFHERKWLKAHVWKTNWDYFAELERKSKQRASAFYELAQTFDETFYGGRPMNEKEYTVYMEKIQKWLEEIENDDVHHG